MPLLTILPQRKKIKVKSGTRLLDAIRQAGFELSSPCNGQQLCGKCKVRLTDPARTREPPLEHLTTDEVAAGVRLACQMRVHAAMEVTLPADATLDVRILEGELMDKNPLAAAVAIQEINGQFQLCYLNRPPVPLHTWQPGFTPKGVAVDLGTTTLVLSLIDLETGKELAVSTAVNPQTRCGHDVMTRIARASTAEGLAELSALISKGLNELVEKSCRASGAHPHEIVDAVIGGNTAMLQIAAAIDPSDLGRLPFTVGIPSGRTVAADAFRLKLNPQARAYIPPVTHAFVGSDISAGLLSVDFFKTEAPTLFIDLGTNGEMALIAKGRVMVTSTAAGPAFEGMGITHGMLALPGAIETVWTNGEFLNLRTIDNAPARGICGSGILDLMACLVRLDAVDSGGRLRNPHAETAGPGRLADRYVRVDGVAALKLTDTLAFTQKDIRQVQLAKSAVQTGIELLLSAAGVGLGHLEQIVMAGAFGYHLRAESLLQIGLVPRDFRGSITFAGNTCRTGCARLLVDAGARNFLQARMKPVTHLDIAADPAFQSRFIRNLSLGGTPTPKT